MSPARAVEHAFECGFAALHDTLDRLGVTPPQAALVNAIHVHRPEEPCQLLVGEEFPSDWTECQEAAWQALCESVDLQQAFDDEREERAWESGGLPARDCN